MPVSKTHRTARRPGHALLLALLGLSAALPSVPALADPGSGVQVLCANPPCAPPPGSNGAHGKAVTTTDLHTADDARKGDRVILNFQGADIATVAKAVGLITRRNFVIDPRVNGTVNIVSAEPVSRDMVYPIFLSALRLQGFAAVEEHGFTKLVPEADAKLNNTPTSTTPQSIAGDRIITQVIQLQYESAAQLLPVLRPLISPNNVINAYANNNTLVITDYAENMARILKVVAAIDVPQAGDVQVLKLQFASALDVATMLGRMLPEVTQSSATGAAPPAGQSGPRSTIATDPRTNSLLIRTDNPATLQRIHQLVDQLDTPAAGTGNIHVVYLRNAEANKVADALRGIVTGNGGSSGSSGSSSGSSLSSQPTSSGPTGSNLGQNATGSGATGSLPTASNVSATSFALPASQGGGVVQAYPANNSLVIVAPDNIYNNLRAVIDKLDARRAQVFVEALVVEVSQTKADAMGIQWQALSGLTGTAARVIGGTNFAVGASSSILTTAAGLAAGSTSAVSQGLNIGLVKGSITLPNGTTLLNLGALANFLQSQTDANVLSTPNLLTIDNEEAKIVVGQNVPFITGSQTSTTSGLTNPFQTIERRDVGLTLRVKPTISEGGTVKMQIYQEVSSVADTTNSAGIITNQRSIESTVLVDDGQIVVLGGLIQDSVTGSLDKVPGLGDLPVVGNLFRSDSRTHQKTNLMVFMRPVILRESNSPAALTADRYDYIRNEQLREQPDHLPLLPDMQAPVLPAYPDSIKQRLPILPDQQSPVLPAYPDPAGKP